jgi:O-antigen/teichoic acid export membrane protein
LFGVQNTVNRFIPDFDQKGQKDKANQIAYSIVSLNLAISIAITLVFVFFSDYISLFVFNTVSVKPYITMLSITFLFVPYRTISQALISRFEIKKNALGVVSGNIAIIAFTLIFLYLYRSIDAFLLGRILGEIVATVILVVQMIRVFGKPQLKIVPKKLVIFSIPLFLTSFLNYFSTYIYNFVFNFYFGDYAKLGFLYYINIFFSTFKAIFDSFDQILIVYYGIILNSEDGMKKYREKTNQISKLMQSLSFIIFIIYSHLAPILIMFVVSLFSQPDFYFEGTLTTILFGLHFIIMMLQYMCATLYHIEKGSNSIFIVHLFTSIAHALFYFSIIKFLGLVGIPVAYVLGNVVYLTLTYLRIKNKMKPSFNKRGLIINFISSIPAFIMIPLLVLFLPRFDNVIIVNLMLFELKVPLVAIIIAIGVLAFSMISYLIISRRLKLFQDEDKELFRQFFNEKMANILIKIFIK